MTDVAETGQSPAPYRVLARKYRPRNFAELIGQEALVRTLSNAIAAGRLAHAFLLTGVRGVGKTTTARIIARALNCIGPDGKGGPTIEPCGVCEHCIAIAEDRHVDVIEMDAASRTGVDDIREVIEGVRYRPVTARYKVYIVDEVHMLTRNAFNALLKTLEEPPEHVKFVFATTEVRRVPVTVLSRCQRFDLRRVDVQTLSEHFTRVAAAEGAEVTPEAIGLLARAADGSVRDGLSLLDQAIAHAGAGGPVGVELVRGMLGLADRLLVFDLYEQVMRGDAAGALALFEDMYRSGVDPLAVVQDMLDLTHWITRARLAPATIDDPGVPEAERVRGRTMAEALSVPALTRNWQILLKGIGEAQHAPAPKLAVEMLFVRLAFAAELPTPAEIVERLGDSGAGNSGAGNAGSGSQGGGGPASPAPASPAPASPAPAARSFTPATPRPPAPTSPPPSAGRRMQTGGGGSGGGTRAAVARPLAADPMPPAEPTVPDPTNDDIADTAFFPDSENPAPPDLDGPDLNGSDLDGPDLDGPDLDGPIFDGPILDGPDLGALPEPGAAPEPAAEPAAPATVEPPASFPELVRLFEERRQPILWGSLMRDVHLVRYRPGFLEFRPNATAPTTLAADLRRQLELWTGRQWTIAVSSTDDGAPTLAEQTAAHDAQLRAEALAHPLVLAALDAFPGARVETIRELGPPPAARAAGMDEDAPDDEAEMAPPEPLEEEDD